MKCNALKLVRFNFTRQIPSIGIQLVVLATAALMTVFTRAGPWFTLNIPKFIKLLRNLKLREITLIDVTCNPNGFIKDLTEFYLHDAPNIELTSLTFNLFTNVEFDYTHLARLKNLQKITIYYSLHKYGYNWIIIHVKPLLEMFPRTKITLIKYATTEMVKIGLIKTPPVYAFLKKQLIAELEKTDIHMEVKTAINPFISLTQYDQKYIQYLQRTPEIHYHEDYYESFHSENSHSPVSDIEEVIFIDSDDNE